MELQSSSSSQLNIEEQKNKKMVFPSEQQSKPHAVCVPYPAQGHINPMLKLAKILHHKGFHITFVHTEYIYAYLVNSRGADSSKGLPSFRYETIPDGNPLPDPNVVVSPQIMPSDTYCLAPFKKLLAKLNEDDDVPPVSCIISDAVMGFTVDAAEELGVPDFMLWVFNALTSLIYTQHVTLVQKGYIPLKDESYMTNGYLDTVITEIPAINGMHLRDLPRKNLVNADPKEVVLKFATPQLDRVRRASGFLVNTFEDLERDAIEALRSIKPSTYAVGLLNLVEQYVVGDDKDLQELGSNLWKEEYECLEWLDSKEPNSVIYVNFGSTALVTPNQIVEIAWGLANSNQPFLLILRADLVVGEASILPSEFLESTKNRGMVTNWCPQEKVLGHPSIGGFLTHSGWNSVLESISNGVPVICWPSFADQYTVCWSCCEQWGIGMEIEDVKRDVVGRLVRELLIGDEGKKMKNRVVEWKELAHRSAKTSSHSNLDKVIDEILLLPTLRD